MSIEEMFICLSANRSDICANFGFIFRKSRIRTSID